MEQKSEAYCQRLKDLVEIVSKSDLDMLLMRYGVRDILEVPQQENGIGNHVANINGSNTPDLGKAIIFDMNTKHHRVMGMILNLKQFQELMFRRQIMMINC